MYKSVYELFIRIKKSNSHSAGSHFAIRYFIVNLHKIICGCSVSSLKKIRLIKPTDVETTATFQLEAICNHPICEQMNLYLNLVSYDDAGQKIAVDYTQAAPLSQATTYHVETSVPSVAVSASIYIVPMGTLTTNRVTDAPNFTLTFRMLRAGVELDAQEISVNPWGGTQLIDLHYPQ